MKLYMRQHVFTIGDRFNVWDEDGHDRWFVEQELLTWGKILRVYDLSGREVASIHQEMLTFRPRFTVTIGGQECAQVVQHFTLFVQEYTVEGPDWHIEGEFLAHEFTAWGRRAPRTLHREGVADVGRLLHAGHSGAARRAAGAGRGTRHRQRKSALSAQLPPQTAKYCEALQPKEAPSGASFFLPPCPPFGADAAAYIPQHGGVHCPIDMSRAAAYNIVY